MAERETTDWLIDSHWWVAATLLLTLIFTVVPALVAPALDRFSANGMPAGYLLLALASPIALIVAGVFFVMRQDAADRVHYPGED